MQDADGLILLVEDDSHQVAFLKRAFAHARIPNPVQGVTDGQAAILFLSDFRRPVPSLVLLDLHLPRVSGLRVLEWMRRRSELRDIPVVIVTTSIEPEDRLRAEGLGVLAWLCKPVCADGVEELMAMVPWLKPAHP